MKATIDFSKYVTLEDPRDPQDRARLICSRIADDLLGLAGDYAASLAPAKPKPFTVITVSTNTNSFGYRSVLCLAEDGEGFEGLVQAYGTDKVPVRGEKVRKDDPRWYAGVRAIAPTLPKNAKKVLKEVAL